MTPEEIRELEAKMAELMDDWNDIMEYDKGYECPHYLSDSNAWDEWVNWLMSIDNTISITEEIGRENGFIIRDFAIWRDGYSIGDRVECPSMTSLSVHYHAVKEALPIIEEIINND